VKWVCYIAASCVCGVTITVGSFLALLWGMPYNAGPLHHAIANVAAVLLYPGFGYGEILLATTAFFYASLTLGFLAWRDRRHAQSKKQLTANC
jgi:hypothetical protein